MKCQIVISDEAKLDIREAKDYYTKLVIKLAKRYIVDISETIDLLSENPTHHQLRYKSIRIAFTNTFPYGIHYTLENKIVYIHRVFHTKRFFK